MTRLKITWSLKAKEQLKEIYDYYKALSPQGATNVKNDILQKARELIFAKQYQQDDIEPEFRRIIVRQYKVIYQIEEDTIWILRIFDTKQNPNTQLEQR